MNNIFSVKGRQDVRYIITRSGFCGRVFSAEEGAAVFKGSLQLLVLLEAKSDICFENAVHACQRLVRQGYSLHLNVYVSRLFREQAVRRLGAAELHDSGIVTDEAGLDEAIKLSHFILTIPSNEQGFYKLMPGNQGPGREPLIIGTAEGELEKALAAACRALERSSRHE